MARSTARRRALNTLYEADEKGQDILSLLDERIARPGAQTPLPDYAIELVRAVADRLPQIDRALDEHSTGWHVKRMAVVDRNILRIATWEIMFNDEVPDKVAIDEALQLAKMLCDDESPAFIHGLLSAISANKGSDEDWTRRDPPEPQLQTAVSHGDAGNVTQITVTTQGDDDAPSNPAIDAEPEKSQNSNITATSTTAGEEPNES